MFKLLKSFTLHLLTGANVASILVMLVVGYSDRINPVSHPVLANVGLAFPVILAVNLAFLVLWLFLKPRMAFIPVVGLLVCYGPIRIYSPLNVPKTPPEGCVKVLSFNVWTWRDCDKPDETIDYIVRENADIVCLQEAGVYGERRERIFGRLDSLYPYRECSLRANNTEETMICSKFPIIRKKDIEFEPTLNSATAYYLLMGRDTVVVINNHLQSNCFSDQEKEAFKTMVKGDMERDSASVESKRLMEKLSSTVLMRGPQADAVAAFVRSCSGRSVILCGDFNDSPISYVRHTIARELVDCYVESGNGPGISYHNSGFYVRIDNIMCSDDWVPYGCKVDSKVKSSDHYPIVCWLKKRQKP